MAESKWQRKSKQLGRELTKFKTKVRNLRARVQAHKDAIALKDKIIANFVENETLSKSIESLQKYIKDINHAIEDQELNIAALKDKNNKHVDRVEKFVGNLGKLNKDLKELQSMAIPPDYETYFKETLKKIDEIEKEKDKKEEEKEKEKEKTVIKDSGVSVEQMVK